MPTELEIMLRLGAAVLLGLTLGIERELRAKPAGLKTIALVTLSAAGLTLLSQHAGEMVGAGSTFDLTRLMAGVVTGIGFIGAGTIIRSGAHVEGVTTAAMIWVMTAVGMAIGAGAWVLGLSVYVLIWATLLLDRVIDGFLKRRGLLDKDAG